MNVADLWALLLMLAGGLFAWWLATRSAERPDRAFLARIVATTFALRVAWSVFQHLIYPRAWSMFAADAIARYVHSARNALLWRQGIWSPRLPQTLSEAHSTVVDLKTTVLIYLFGPSPMLPEAFTITFNVTIIIAIYLIARHIGATRNAARAATLFAAFIPSLVFWSTQDLKDPVTATCIAWATLAMFKVGERAHGGYLLLFIIADLIAIVYRPYVGILLVVGQGLAVAATVRLPRTPLGTITRIAMFTIIAPIALQFGIKEMQETYGETFDLQWAVESYMMFRQSGIEGGLRGSEYAIPLTASNPTQAILQLPLRILLLLLSPIPLFPGTFRRMLTYPEMWFIYLFVVPRFVAGVREAWNKNRPALLTILLVLAPIIVSYALKTALSGEAIRMRAQFVPVLLIFAGVGHAVYERRRTEQRQRSHKGILTMRYVEAQSTKGSLEA